MLGGREVARDKKSKSQSISPKELYGTKKGHGNKD